MTQDEKDSEDSVKFNSMMDRVRDMVNRMPASNSGGNVQTVVHTGMSRWGAAAVTACFSTLVLMILMCIIFVYLLGNMQRQIGDLQAWKDIHAAKIAKLEAGKNP